MFVVIWPTPDGVSDATDHDPRPRAGKLKIGHAARPDSPAFAKFSEREFIGA
jgi:hypothetical protein